MKCSYGCNQKAKYKFKNGRWCCSSHHSSCPGVKEKRPKYLSEEHKQKIKEKLKNKKIKEKIVLANTGNKNPNWKGGYDKLGICRYDQYHLKLCYAEKTKRNDFDPNILEVRCAYCGKWYIPNRGEVVDRLTCLNNPLAYGECRFYCSIECKQECPTFNQVLYPKGFKPATSREVQPELRQMRFKIDNYTCQHCKKTEDELNCGLHCHHIEGIRWDPLESADIDKVITLCKNCHIEVHKLPDCRYSDLKCLQKTA